MHPYMIDRMVEERRDELLRLARAGRGVRSARGARIGRRRRKADVAAPAPATQPDMTPACCPG